MRIHIPRSTDYAACSSARRAITSTTSSDPITCSPWPYEPRGARPFCRSLGAVPHFGEAHHQAHQPLHAFAVDLESLSAKHLQHFPASVERSLQVQLADTAHERERLRAR